MAVCIDEAWCDDAASAIDDERAILNGTSGTTGAAHEDDAATRCGNFAGIWAGSGAVDDGTTNQNGNVIYGCAAFMLHIWIRNGRLS